VSEPMRLALVGLGIILVIAGLVRFFYPKPPSLDFSAFLGGNTRLYISLACILIGGVLAVAGILPP
jgi:hypothetical protein